MSRAAHFKLPRVMFAIFCEVFHPRNFLLNSLLANYQNFDQVKDRKLNMTF